MKKYDTVWYLFIVIVVIIADNALSSHYIIALIHPLFVGL